MKATKLNSMKRKWKTHFSKISAIVIIGLLLGASPASGQCFPKTLSVPNEPLKTPYPPAEQLIRGSKEYKQSEVSLESASVVVFGEPARWWNLDYWCNDLKSTKYASLPQCKDGLSYVEAVNTLKLFLREQDSWRQLPILKNIYLEVFGREPNPNDIAYGKGRMQSGQAWYTIIRAGEITYLHATKPEKTATINRAYYAWFGREPTADETNYWLARNEHYSEIKQANRNWLYSPAGKNELANTIDRAFVKLPKATDEWRKTAANKWIAEKRIFEEMPCPE